MVRKSLAIFVLLACFVVPAYADDQRAARDPRTRGEAAVRKTVRIIKSVVGNGDGISIPKP